MIKKNQKWIALLVTLTFMWLLQVSTMPLNAAGTNEPAAAASPDQGPRFVEKEDAAAPAAGKKSILPLVLIGVGVVAVAAVLFLVVLKTKYDITGSWNFIFTHGSGSNPYTLTFSGTKGSGNYTTAGNPLLAGTYTVVDKDVTFTVNSYPAIQFKGQFTEKDKMSGTYVEGSFSFTWTATRGTEPASVKPVRPGQSQLFPK